MHMYIFSEIKSPGKNNNNLFSALANNEHLYPHKEQVLL